MHPLPDPHINLRRNLCAVGSSAIRFASFVIVIAARKLYEVCALPDMLPRIIAAGLYSDHNMAPVLTRACLPGNILI